MDNEVGISGVGYWSEPSCNSPRGLTGDALGHLRKGGLLLIPLLSPPGVTVGARVRSSRPSSASRAPLYLCRWCGQGRAGVWNRALQLLTRWSMLGDSHGDTCEPTLFCSVGVLCSIRTHSLCPPAPGRLTELVGRCGRWACSGAARTQLRPGHLCSPQETERPRGSTTRVSMPLAAASLAQQGPGGAEQGPTALQPVPRPLRPCGCSRVLSQSCLSLRSRHPAPPRARPGRVLGSRPQWHRGYGVPHPAAGGHSWEQRVSEEGRWTGESTPWLLRRDTGKRAGNARPLGYFIVPQSW